MKGVFITFEGSEGSGKSTQIAMIHKYLKKQNHDVVLMREPGGVKISEKIRRILLDNQNEEMNKECEMLLYMAARAQLTHEVLIPALKEGKIVLCDRFLDSTVVYQGYGIGMDVNFIKRVGSFATQDTKPDLTFIFDIDAQKGLSRINRQKDRIENRDISYHNKVRFGYNEIAKKEPKRIKLISVDRPKEDIHLIVRQHIDQLIKNG